jgi:hypothetical protein
VHTFVAPPHTPPMQAGVGTQRLVEPHVMPFVLLVATQGEFTGLLASHAPTVQSVLSAEQSLAFAEQAPDVHVPAVSLQPLLPHAVPSWTGW